MGSIPVTAPLLVVDVQEGFINAFTQHIPERVAALIERDDYDPVLFTRFVNTENGPYHRFIGWEACADEPEINLTPGVASYARVPVRSTSLPSPDMPVFPKR